MIEIFMLEVRVLIEHRSREKTLAKLTMKKSNLNLVFFPFLNLSISKYLYQSAVYFPAEI